MKNYQFYAIMTALLAINSNVEADVIARGGSSLAAIFFAICAVSSYVKVEKK